MQKRKRLRAAVVGGSGYGGAEIIRRLLVHPEVELARVASVDHVGEPLGAAHPSLEGASALVFEDLPPAEAARGADVVLFALPHKVTAQKVAELVRSYRRDEAPPHSSSAPAPPSPVGGRSPPPPPLAPVQPHPAGPALVRAAPPVVVDMSGDFRLRSADSYARWYGAPHPHPELLGEFVYGLPELHRERIRGARLVASPGCFATSVELALLPLARAGALEGLVHVQGITGSSGSGVAPSPTTHHPVRAGNLRTYKPLEHQHLPEIAEALTAGGARDLELRFVPISAPLGRGIFTTAFVELPEAFTEARVRALYEEAYAPEPFVRVPRKRLPEVAAVSGSNHAEVGLAVGPAWRGRRTVTLFCALDNLVKGGAGQAIQNMNLALGLDETLSLEDTGPWPP
jgi:LysW-gamma-L-alpha-aminoadipyl-6-phosphate/LysW-L-glutamyl-5-phosphate reductase